MRAFSWTANFPTYGMDVARTCVRVTLPELLELEGVICIPSGPRITYETYVADHEKQTLALET